MDDSGEKCACHAYSAERMDVSLNWRDKSTVKKQVKKIDVIDTDSVVDLAYKKRNSKYCKKWSDPAVGWTLYSHR